MAHIVHFAKYYTPRLGGIESVTNSLSRGAVKHGHIVTVICFDNNRKNIKHYVDGVFVIRTPISWIFFSQPFSTNYLFQCIINSRKADIVHLHYPNLLAVVGLLFVTKNTRIVVHWHSDVVGKDMLTMVIRPLEFLMLKLANRVVATSKPYAKASESLKGFQSKVTIVPIGYRSKGNFFNLNDENIKFNGKSYILSVGRLVKYKCFDTLILAGTYIDPNTDIVIVGEGPLAAELQSLIVKLNLIERVFLVGRQSDEQLNALFSNASIFCLPSGTRAEAFGVVLVEAMSHGLPIVSTEIPGSGVSWVNLHGVSGLNVSCHDPKALAGACNDIIASSELKRKLSEGSRNRYISEFTEEGSIKLMNEVYESLL